MMGSRANCVHCIKGNKVDSIVLQVITVLRRWGVGKVHGLRDRLSKFRRNLREDIKLAFLDIIIFNMPQMTCNIGNQICQVLGREFIDLDRRVSSSYSIRKIFPYKLPWPFPVNTLVNLTEATNGFADPNAMIARAVGRWLELHLIHGGRIIWP